MKSITIIASQIAVLSAANAVAPSIDLFSDELNHSFTANLEHVIDPELAFPDSLTGTGYWGEDYMHSVHGPDEAKNFGWSLGRAFQILPEIRELSSVPDLTRLLARFVSSQSAGLRDLMKQTAIPTKQSSSISVLRIESYESFVSAMTLISTYPEAAGDSNLRARIAGHILEHSDSAADEFAFCLDYCMHSGAYRSGIDCAANFDMMKVLKALGDLTEDPKYSELISKISMYSDRVSTSFSLIDGLNELADTIADYLLGFQDEHAIEKDVEIAIQQVGYAEEEFDH